MPNKRHSGRRGAIKAAIGGSQLITNELLSSSDYITFESDNPIWDQSDPDYPCIEPDGLLAGGEISPDTSNDSVVTAAGSAYIGGATISFAADDAVAVSRPSAGETRITAIVVDSAGAVTGVAGTSGAPGGARGAAGGPPYIPVDKVLLGYVTLTSSTSALVVDSEIDVESAERAAVPAYVIDYINGTVVFASEDDLIHTGDTARKVYATYKFLIVQTIGNLKNWQVTVSSEKHDLTAFDEQWTSSEKGANSWSGSFGGFHVNGYWFDRAVAEDASYYLEFFSDNRKTASVVGFAILDWDVNVARDAPVEETINFTGNGPLTRVGSFGC